MMAARANRNPEVELAEHLDALSRAARLQFAALWALRAAVAGIVADVLLLLAARYTTLPLERSWLVLPPLAMLLAVPLVTILRRPSTLALARRADRELHLRERLTTAVEMRRQQTEHPFAPLQLADTLAHVRRVPPSQAFPLRAGRLDLGMLVASLAVALLLLFLPVPQRPPLPDQSRVQEAIKQEADRVSALADQVGSEQPNEGDQETRAAIAKALRDASQALEKNPGSAEKAVAALSEGEQGLSNLQNPQIEDLRQALARAAEALRREATTRDAGTSLAQGDGQSAANALHALGNEAGNMSQGQRAAAAQALGNAANSASRSNPQLGQSLNQASEALASGDPAAAQNALDRAASDLQQATQESNRQDLVERALAQLERSRSAIAGSAQPSTAERSPQSGGDNAGAQADRSAQAAPSRGESNGPGDQGGTNEPGNDQGQPGGGGAGKGSLERSTAVFDPNNTNSHQEQDSSPEMDRPSVSASDQSGAPAQGTSSVDYRDVYATYRDRATAATQDRYIPLDLKELVKNYFSSLDPSH